MLWAGFLKKIRKIFILGFTNRRESCIIEKLNLFCADVVQW